MTSWGSTLASRKVLNRWQELQLKILHIYELQEECFQRARVTGRHIDLNYPEKEIAAFSTLLDVLNRSLPCS